MRLRRLLNPLPLLDPRLERIEDIQYAPGAGRRHRLDVIRLRGGDREARSPAPVLLQIHGGAWIIGDKRQQGLPLVSHLAAQGWVCVATNYRLSPRSTFPDHLVDCKLALRWIREHIAEQGGDPSLVVVTGGSAGGHLAAMLALTPNDPEWQPGFEDVDTSVAACIPFYGVYDFTDRFGIRGSGDPLRPLLERFVMKAPLARARAAYERASPMSHVGPHAPPFLVVHGTHDNLVPVEEARRFVALLRERSRAPVAYAEIPGAHHAFDVLRSVRALHVVCGVERFLAWLLASRGLALPAPSGAPVLGERPGRRIPTGAGRNLAQHASCFCGATRWFVCAIAGWLVVALSPLRVVRELRGAFAPISAFSCAGTPAAYARRRLVGTWATSPRAGWNSPIPP